MTLPNSSIKTSCIRRFYGVATDYDITCAGTSNYGYGNVDRLTFLVAFDTDLMAVLVGNSLVQAWSLHKSVCSPVSSIYFLPHPINLWWFIRVLCILNEWTFDLESLVIEKGGWMVLGHYEKPECYIGEPGKCISFWPAITTNSVVEYRATNVAATWICGHPQMKKTWSNAHF